MRIVHLYGTWREMGRQYGEQLSDSLRRVYAFMQTKANSPERWSQVELTARSLYSHYPDELRTFVGGIAETSGLSIEELQIVNAVEFAEPAFFCSLMAAWGDYTKGELLVGRNYDEISYLPIETELLVTVYHPEGTQWVATIGYTGEIYALNGMNESGIFLELNNGMPSGGFGIDYDEKCATAELLMLLFRAKTMADVDAFFATTRSFGSFLIGVANGTEARSYEWCREGAKRGGTDMPEGLLLQTNHYVNPEWAYPVPADEACWHSHTRRCNLRTMAEAKKGQLEAQDIMQIMQTPIEQGGPMFAIGSGRVLTTMYQLVVAPGSCRLWARAAQGEWEEILLTDPATQPSEDLRTYVEEAILPCYEDFDAAHRGDHARQVIEQSMRLAAVMTRSSAYADAEGHPLRLNRDMVYAIAACHDLGLCVDRKTHHLESGRIIRENPDLRRWFNEEQIETMAQAAEDHRASSDHEPRSIYGKIVAEADRLIDIETILRRTIQYGFAHYPQMSREEHIQRALAHLDEKYAEGGYLKLWIPESPNRERLHALWTLIADREKLQEIVERIYDEQA